MNTQIQPTFNTKSNRALTVEKGPACDGGFLQKRFACFSLHSVLVTAQPREHTVQGLKLRYMRNDAQLHYALVNVIKTFFVAISNNLISRYKKRKNLARKLQPWVNMKFLTFIVNLKEVFILSTAWNQLLFVSVNDISSSFISMRL